MGGEEFVGGEVMYLAQNLKYLRKSRGETQEVLAEEIGITPSALANYEQGQREPCIEKLIILADYFEVSVDDLIRKDLQPPKPKCADNLKYLRKKHRISQDDIGKFVGISQKGVSKYERGECEIPLPKLMMLTGYFGVTLDQFVKQDLSQIDDEKAGLTQEQE